jgi:hypothetical protein
VWPFFAFVPIFLLRFLNGHRELAASALCVLIFLFGTASVLHTTGLDRQNLDTVALITDATKVLVDNVHRGVLPRLLLHMRDGQTVLAADQPYLLAHSDKWLDRIGSESIYVTSSYGNADDRQEEIRRRLELKYKVITDNSCFGKIHSLRAEQADPTRG